MADNKRLIERLSVFLSETLGTGILVFFGCLGCLTWGNEYNHLQTCLSFGIVAMISIQIFGCVSGAHINPAVSVAAAVYNLIDVQTMCLYIVGQFVGAFMGYGLIILITSKDILKMGSAGNGLCVVAPHVDVLPWQAFVVEFVASAALVAFCCGIWDPRNAVFQDSAPLKFGLAISGLCLVAGPFSGAGLNPARTFAPALWNEVSHHQWIYFIAPLSAAFITANVFKYVFRREIYELPSAK